MGEIIYEFKAKLSFTSTVKQAKMGIALKFNTLIRDMRLMPERS